MVALGPRLSIVVPTRNEAANLPLLVDRLETALPSGAFELCIVDDSDDDTPAVIERLAAARPGRIRALFRPPAERQGGLSTAVVAGLRMAQGEYVCVMDADLQHPPELIPAMLAGADAGADLVVASRYARGGSSRGLSGTVRRVVSRTATALARIVFWEARRSTDPLSGFFLCRRGLVDGIEFRPVGFKILLELLVLLPNDVSVRDVPLRFEVRAHGQSKATVSQGVLYLRHLRPLFVDVPGAGRLWKFAIVGGSGLAIFLPVLGLLGGRAGFHPLLAFLPAFALSLAWNTLLNRLWTFADQRRRTGGTGPARYLRWASLSGLLMFGSFAALYAAGLALLLAGVLAAGVGVAANGIANRREVSRQPAAWTQMATNLGVQGALRQLAAQVGADRAYLLPADPRAGDTASLPGELLARAVARRRPMLWTEAPSHRPQRRANIESTSILIVPVVDAGQVSAIVICERWAPRGFDASALEIATRAASGIATAIARAATLPGADVAEVSAGRQQEVAAADR
jgi:dolichol-phosphate mannosyltransferase